MAATDHVTGYQHVGIPTADIEATGAFFMALGFQKRYETENNGKVIFYEWGDVLIETYENSEQATGRQGAINHVALAVDDLDKTIEEVNKTGYAIVEGPAFLTFWEKGVRYIVVAGPDDERVEFLQKF